MTTDNKTLADVQPGGRVRLPQAGQFDSELLWWLMDAASTLSEGGNESHAERLRSLHAALSAHPSPGGQGDSRSEKAETFLRQYLTYLRSSPRQGLRPRWCDVYEALEVAIEALAARQPVASNQPSGNSGELAVDGDRQPVGEPVARSIIEEFVQCADVGRAPGKLLAQARDYLAAPPVQAVNLGPASIPDTPEVRDILGRPNFWCSPWANVLRMRGDAIPRKAEEEQAAVIRFMLNHYLAHGADWAETAGAELDAIRKADSQAVGK